MPTKDEPDTSGTLTRDDAPISEEAPISTAALGQATLAMNPEIVAGSLREYVRLWASRVRGGRVASCPSSADCC